MCGYSAVCSGPDTCVAARAAQLQQSVQLGCLGLAPTCTTTYCTSYSVGSCNAVDVTALPHLLHFSDCMCSTYSTPANNLGHPASHAKA